MYEILFRAKEKTEPSRWQYGYYVRHKLNNPCPVVFFGDKPDDRRIEYEEYLIIEQDGDWNLPSTQYKCAIQPHTVGQYTTRDDIHGKKIFVGDVVQGTIVSQWGKSKIVCEVVFERDGFVCLERTPYNTWSHKLMFAKDIEVIGNIYDNPELFNYNVERGILQMYDVFYETHKSPTTEQLDKLHTDMLKYVRAALKCDDDTAEAFIQDTMMTHKA